MEEFVRQAIRLAYASAKKGDDPFAALLVKDGQVVATSLDESVSRCDPTAHAELALIRDYCSSQKVFSLEGYTLVSSTEPCLMCSGAIHWSRISQVVFSVSQATLKGFSQGTAKPTCESLLNLGRRKVQVIGPLLEEEGIKVFQDYPLVPKIQRVLQDNSSEGRHS
jgi:tRNA(Arg) A34 adenosine deaminase TadA